jgi:hypothetical protein
VIRVHKLLDSARVVEFYVGRETAQKLELLPINYQENVELAFEEKVEVEFARWQETMA